MLAFKYDKDSAESIYEFSLNLKGNSLSSLVSIPEKILNEKNRGDLGNFLEKYYFENSPPNSHEPDFPEAQLELKTTGLVKLSSNKFKAKERLVLTTINYKDIVNETWETSVLFNKCRKMLLVFYEYLDGVPVTELIFPVSPMIYEICGTDLDVIKSDWEFIRDKVIQGLAHELSEGDTFYLGACRKGSGGPAEKQLVQPNSKIPAKSRAFSFKQSYLNQLLAQHQVKEVNLQVKNDFSIEKVTTESFESALGMSVESLATKFDFHKKGISHKGYHRELSLKILNSGSSTISSLQKAGIIVKVIRLAKTNKAREAMSFPAFNPEDVMLQEWEQSDFYQITEQKFLFVVYKSSDDGVERLEKVGYWNMPYEDRLEAQRVWEDTKKAICEGRTDFPKAKNSHVAHVRPHARNAADTQEFNKGVILTKQCFWLNQKYISNVLLGI
jgi:DNA mismatch repair protein MutH